MKIIKSKIYLSILILTATIFALGLYLLLNSEGKNETIVFAEQEISDPEKGLDVEIIEGTGGQTLDTRGEGIEEKILEVDAERLSVNEETKNIEAEKAGSEEKNWQKYPLLPAPLKRSSSSDELRIGFITDLHVQSVAGMGISLDRYYADKLNYFIEKMNNVFSPNFILLDGDVIEGTRTESAIGMKELSLVKKIADRTTIKKYWVVGNHDLRSLSKKQWKDTLGIDYINKSFDVGKYKIILLDGNFTKGGAHVGPGIGYTRGNVSSKQIEWLKNELGKTKKKVVVIMHYPPLRDIDAKNNVNLLYNAKELQSIFSQYGVLAVFSGHIEDLYFKEIDGVDYFVSPGMVKHPKYAGAFSEITIKGGATSITLNYLVGGNNYRTIKIKK